MKKNIGFIFLMVGQLYLAQHQFEIRNGSKQFDAKVTVQTCEGDTCSGEGSIELIDKKTRKVFQTLTSEDLYFYLNEDQKPSVNVIQLYNEQSPLIFDDFNFDDTEDIAVRNGNQSGYGGPSYDIYVYNSTRKQFVPSEELTALAYENLGMFQTDQKRKRIITFAKSVVAGISRQSMR